MSKKTKLETVLGVLSLWAIAIALGAFIVQCTECSQRNGVWVRTAAWGTCLETEKPEDR